MYTWEDNTSATFSPRYGAAGRVERRERPVELEAWPHVEITNGTLAVTILVPWNCPPSSSSVPSSAPATGRRSLCRATRPASGSLRSSAPTVAATDPDAAGLDRVNGASAGLSIAGIHRHHHGHPHTSGDLERHRHRHRQRVTGPATTYFFTWTVTEPPASSLYRAVTVRARPSRSAGFRSRPGRLRRT